HECRFHEVNGRESVVQHELGHLRGEDAGMAGRKTGKAGPHSELAKGQKLCWLSADSPRLEPVGESPRITRKRDGADLAPGRPVPLARGDWERLGRILGE